MDKTQVEAQLEWPGMPEDKRWPGFTAKIGVYDTSDGKQKTEEWCRKLTEQKPPAVINGICFRFLSAKVVEETPNAGYIVTEYVQADERAEDEKSHLLVLSSNRGRYAIDDPEGMDLQSGMVIMIKLAGMWIRGTAERDRDGYYFEASNGGCCGLTPGMRIRLA